MSKKNTDDAVPYIDFGKFWQISYYYQVYKKLPLTTGFYEVHFKKLLKKLKKEQRDESYFYYNGMYESNNKRFSFTEALIDFGDEILLHVDDMEGEHGEPVIALMHSHDSDKIKVNELIAAINQCQKKGINKTREMYVLQADKYGHEDITSFELKKQPLDINQNYNDDFPPVYKRLLDKLNKKKEGGLVLLFGNTGTGKTSLIRHLATKVKRKMILFQSEDFIQMGKPRLIRLLSNYPESVIVLEDAETLLMKRKESNAGTVSALLNLTDGLLTDYLNIKVICTFNSNLPKIDEAILRKGRLIMSYEFKELATEKSNALLKKLNVDYVTEIPLTLSEIYNVSEDNNTSTEKIKIGFKKG